MIDSTREGNHTVVGQNITEQGTESGIIDIRLEYAFAQVV